MAFFGAYALLNLTVFYYAMPQFKGIRKYDEKAGLWGFWTMVASMFFLSLVFGIAGILQVYLERFLDIGYSTAHMSMMFWFKTAIFFGVIFLSGALTTVYHLFSLKPAAETA
jgi:nitric oxide reductase subunit B